MTTSPPSSPPPSTPGTVFARLVEQLAAAGHAPPEVPASVTTPEALAAALFDVAARTGAALFSVRATRDDDADGEEEGLGTEERITADITFFFIAEDAPERVGLLGTEQVPIRQPIAYALYRPLGKALEAHAQRGADPKSPQRGEVRFPAGAANPDVWFRVSFRDEAMGTWTTARARDRETQQAFPRLADLPLAPDAAAFLEERFRRLDTLLQGQWVLFTGEAGTGRGTSLRAAMDALPDDVNALAAMDAPRGAASGAVGVVRVGQDLTMAKAVRSILRQDPDLIFADEVRTVDDLRLLANSALTGHGVACVLEAKTPEDAQAWLTKALPGVTLHPLIVHHTRDATTGALTITLHEAKPAGENGAVRVTPWTSGAPRPQEVEFMRQAIQLARDNAARGGRPFGAVLVRDGQLIASATNEIHTTGDPTAHAELLAIRRASQALGNPRLEGCVVYASGHPCPMCLAAMTLCGVTAAFYGYSNEEGEPFGLSTSAVYAELGKPMEDRRMKLASLRPEGESGLYTFWKSRQR